MEDAFLEYCWSFYGPKGLYAEFFREYPVTRKELKAACDARRATEHYADGDSFDREAVREILFAAKGMPRGSMI
jgi:hypothetical protein